MNQAIIGKVELSGRKEVREPKSELVKLTSKDKRAESQSIGKEQKDPNTKDITRSDNNMGP